MSSRFIFVSSLFGSLFVVVMGFVVLFCCPCILSFVTGCNLLQWKTLLTLHCSGSSSQYVRGPMTLLIVYGPYQRASHLGEGQSVTRSVESSHT